MLDWGRRAFKKFPAPKVMTSPGKEAGCTAVPWNGREFFTWVHLRFRQWWTFHTLMHWPLPCEVIEFQDKKEKSWVLVVYWIFKKSFPRKLLLELHTVSSTQAGWQLCVYIKQVYAYVCVYICHFFFFLHLSLYFKLNQWEGLLWNCVDTASHPGSSLSFSRCQLQVWSFST